LAAAMELELVVVMELELVAAVAVVVATTRVLTEVESQARSTTERRLLEAAN